MKYLILFCIIGLALAAPIEDDSPDTDAVESKCRTLNHIYGTDEEVSQLFENPPAGREDDIKCFMDCLLTEIGLLENGQFSDTMNALKYIPFTNDDDIDEETIKLLGYFKACGDVVGEGKCDLAYKFTLCLAEKTADVV